MDSAGYLVRAVVIEKRSVREVVAAAHGVSKTWLYELVARYREGGDDALVHRSIGPRVEGRRVRLSRPGSRRHPPAHHRHRSSTIGFAMTGSTRWRR